MPLLTKVDFTILSMYPTIWAIALLNHMPGGTTVNVAHTADFQLNRNFLQRRHEHCSRSGHSDIGALKYWLQIAPIDDGKDLPVAL